MIDLFYFSSYMYEDKICLIYLFKLVVVTSQKLNDFIIDSGQVIQITYQITLKELTYTLTKSK